MLLTVLLFQLALTVAALPFNSLNVIPLATSRHILSNSSFTNLSLSSKLYPLPSVSVTPVSQISTAVATSLLLRASTSQTTASLPSALKLSRASASSDFVGTSHIASSRKAFSTSNRKPPPVVQLVLPGQSSMFKHDSGGLDYQQQAKSPRNLKRIETKRSNLTHNNDRLLQELKKVLQQNNDDYMERTQPESKNYLGKGMERRQGMTSWDNYWNGATTAYSQSGDGVDGPTTAITDVKRSPSVHDNGPPTADTERWPAAGDERPPAVDVYWSPDADAERPPTAAAIGSPTAGDDRPPAADADRPPAAGGDRPLAAGADRPPAAGADRSPTADAGRRHHYRPRYPIRRSPAWQPSTSLTVSLLPTVVETTSKKEDITHKQLTTKQTTRKKNEKEKSKRNVKRFMAFVKKNREMLKKFIAQKKAGRSGAAAEQGATQGARQGAEKEAKGHTRSAAFMRGLMGAVLHATREFAANQLDMAPARGEHIEKLRMKGRICERHVLKPEGPKYNSRGITYVPEFVESRKKHYDVTKQRHFILPACCNCCKKSVLGCE